MKIRTLLAATCAIALCNAAVLADEVTVLMLKPDPTNPRMFDKKSLTAKAGTKVRIFFQNQSAIPQERNFLILKPGTKDRVSALANAMLSDPNARAQKYIPKSNDIIIHTNLLDPGITGAMQFTLPEEAGDYPYLCTVPGTSFLMNGILKVTK
jgi:azurin